MAGPLDDFVARLRLQIDGFEAHETVVEVELREGSRAAVHEIDSEPGYGFVTLRPHPENGEAPEQWIVPISSIARITLREADAPGQIGFAPSSSA
jgi:hypothetical protein